MKNKKDTFYITTTLPYINAAPHIGTAMEMIRADVIARYKRHVGYHVFFNTGTDEHGQKVYESAIAKGKTPQEYVDEYAMVYKSFHKLFNISYDSFIRTTDIKHIKAAQKMWNLCKENGDIYKAKQKINYCVGCEMEKTDSDLDKDNKCPDHPNRELIMTEEENYFFRFSKYQNKLLNLYDSGLVKPEFRNNEIRKFVERGLHDFSISRLKNKMPWGVSIPGDDEHVMYVWFDALTSYIATLDWADNGENFKKYWTQNDKREVIQVCGKDNIKAQAAIWQSMLFSANIPNTKIININGHIISGGLKMSKSLGNVINPFDIVDKYQSLTQYPEEVLRFIMCHEVSNYDDSDITIESINISYKTYLQNGIGNQLSRILKLTSQYINQNDINLSLEKNKKISLDKDFIKLMDSFYLNEALHLITNKSAELDEYIQKTEPFKLLKDNKDLKPEENDKNKELALEVLKSCIDKLLDISLHLSFFMPKTSEFIYDTIKQNKALETGLFRRI